MARTKLTVDDDIQELATQLSSNTNGAQARVMTRAREVFDHALAKVDSFEEALAHVMWEGYLLGKHAKKPRKRKQPQGGALRGQPQPGEE